MKKAMSKMMAYLLVLTMVLALVPVTAFAKSTYYIKVSSDRRGDVIPDGGSDSMYAVDRLKDATFVFDPNNGYQVKDVLVDGVSVGAMDEYTFESVLESHTLSVSFEKNPNYGKTAEEVAEAEEIAAEEDAWAAELATRVKLFQDVAIDSEYYNGVTYVYNEGFMTGISDTFFGIDLSVTRGMIASILYRLDGSNAVSRGMEFTDVPEEKYYAEAVKWAYAKGVVSGYDATTFAPENTITNQEFISILYRYAKCVGLDVSVGEDTNVLSYEDALSISSYAYEAYQWACGAGVVGDGTTLEPRATATRGNIANALYLFDEMVAAQ